MKIQKGGKNVTIAREELETLVKHIGEFEKLVNSLSRLEASGKLLASQLEPETSDAVYSETNL